MKEAKQVRSPLGGHFKIFLTSMKGKRKKAFLTP